MDIPYHSISIFIYWRVDSQTKSGMKVIMFHCKMKRHNYEKAATSKQLTLAQQWTELFGVIIHLAPSLLKKTDSKLG